HQPFRPLIRKSFSPMVKPGLVAGRRVSTTEAFRRRINGKSLDPPPGANCYLSGGHPVAPTMGPLLTREINLIVPPRAFKRSAKPRRRCLTLARRGTRPLPSASQGSLRGLGAVFSLHFRR